MNNTSNSNLFLGAVCLVFALIVLFIWIPLDIETGVIETVRRRLVVGDSLAPTVAAVFVLLGGLLLIITEGRAPSQAAITSANLRFLGSVLGLLLLALLLMRYAGPLAAHLIGAGRDQSLEYRLLRDTVPWKYIGFISGGGLLVAGTIAIIEGRLSMRALRIAVVAVIVMIAIYDLPFDDLLLPPNGDV
ncbi:MAG: hypothetical protein AB8C46_13340 [Burkholderiaceae bacterium]